MYAISTFRLFINENNTVNAMYGLFVITALTYLKSPLTLQILTIAVLSILLTAPIGVVGIAVSGPRLLRRSETKQETGDKGEVEPILDGSNPQMDSTV